MFTYVLEVLGSWMFTRIWSRLRFFAGNENSLLAVDFRVLFFATTNSTHNLCFYCGPLSTVALVSCGVATMIKEARASDRVLFS